MRHFSPRELLIICEILGAVIFGMGALHCLANRSRWDEVSEMDKPGYKDKGEGSGFAQFILIVGVLVLGFVVLQIIREGY